MESLLENPWSITLLLTGLIFVLAGYLLVKFPPKKINALYGYRTRSSMKSQERWDFSQAYAGREMIGSGVILFLLGFAGPFLPFSAPVAAGTSLFIVILFAVIPILRVESALKRRFKELD
jgi:uncharacterized membrane protein